MTLGAVQPMPSDWLLTPQAHLRQPSTVHVAIQWIAGAYMYPFLSALSFSPLRVVLQSPFVEAMDHHTMMVDNPNHYAH